MVINNQLATIKTLKTKNLVNIQGQLQIIQIKLPEFESKLFGFMRVFKESNRK